MWLYKCSGACFSGLLGHFAVLWLLTPFHTICPVSLAPRVKQTHKLVWHLLLSFACFLNFGTCWPIFLLLMLLFANTINTIFSPFLPKDIYWKQFFWKTSFSLVARRLFEEHLKEIFCRLISSTMSLCSVKIPSSVPEPIPGNSGGP